MTANPVDPGRINIFERKESQEALEAFRSGGPSPSDEQSAAMVSTSAAGYDIAGVRPLFGDNLA